MKPVSDQEENELVILHLRQLCEAKQKTHIHIGEGPSVRRCFFFPLTYFCRVYIFGLSITEEVKGVSFLCVLTFRAKLLTAQIYFSASSEFYRRF